MKVHKRMGSVQCVCVFSLVVYVPQVRHLQRVVVVGVGGILECDEQVFVSVVAE